jgi:hypothetical protein
MRLRRDSPDKIRQKSSALKAGHKENRMNTLPQDAWRSNICRAKTRNIEPLLIAEWPIQRGEIARDPIDGKMRPVEVVLWWLLSGADGTRKSGEHHSADAHRRIAEIMRTPEMRQRISGRTKEGMGSLPELRRMEELLAALFEEKP